MDFVAYDLLLLLAISLFQVLTVLVISVWRLSPNSLVTADLLLALAAVDLLGVLLNFPSGATDPNGVDCNFSGSKSKQG